MKTNIFNIDLKTTGGKLLSSSVVNPIRSSRIILLFVLLFLCVTDIFGATSTTVYYAIPAANVISGANCYTVKINVNFKGDGDDWATYTMTKEDKTKDGKLIYKATFTDKYNGLGCIQFQLYNGSTWVSQIQPFGTYTWTSVSTYNNKMWVHGGSSWSTYTTDASYTVYFVNAGSWATPKAYAFNNKCDYNAAWSGATMTSTGKTYNGKTIYSITLNKRYANIIFSNNGSSQTEDLTLGTTNAGKMYTGSAWTAYRYDVTITFNANGHGSAPSSITILNGDKATAPTAPSETGYTFGGWYTNEACTSAWNWSSAVNENKTLYAKWTANSYTVSFINDGHGTTAPSSNQTVGQLAGVSINATPSAGFRFSNWEITSGTGTFADAATTALNTFYPTSAATIKANFAEDALDLVVNGQGATNGNRLRFGDPVTLDATVGASISGAYTITFYDANNAVLGTKSGNTSTSRTVSYSYTPTVYPASDPNVSFVCKAKITSNASYTSSTYSTTTVYVKTPTSSAVSKTATLNLGASQTISGTFSDILGSSVTITVSVTGPENYSTTDAKNTTASFKYTFTPQRPGSYSVNVSYCANGTEWMKKATTFTVTTPSVSLGTNKPNATALLADGTSTATLTATKNNVDASATVTYTFYESSTALATQSGNTYSYSTATAGTKSLKVVMNVTVDGITTNYTSSTISQYTKYYIYVKNNCSWSTIANYMWQSSNTSNKNADWPGATLSKYPNSSSDFYQVELNTYYNRFIINNGNNNEQTVDETLNTTNFAAGTFWSFEYVANSSNPKKYNMVSMDAVTAPKTITLTQYELTSSSVRIQANITHDGGSTVNEVYYKLGDARFDATLKDGHYVDRTITGLTAGSANTIKFYATNAFGTTEKTISVVVPSRVQNTIYVCDNASWGTMRNHHYTAFYPTNGIGENPTSRRNVAWPGAVLTQVSGAPKWYAVEIDNYYSNFILNNNGTQQTNDLITNPATFTNGSHWRLNYDRDADGKTYYNLVAVTAPTVNLYYSEFNATSITVSANVSDYGNLTDKYHITEVASAYGFTIKDNVTNVVTDVEACSEHLYANDEYWNFEHTFTNLVPGRSYTITAWVRYCNLTGRSAATTNTTSVSGTKFVRVKNDMNWYAMNLYAYATTKCGDPIEKTYELMPLGVDNWYYAYVSNEYSYFQVNDGGPTRTDTIVLAQDCFTNKYNGKNNKLGKATTCPSLNLYQVEIVDGDNIYHSNVVDNIADTLSFYAKAGAITTLIHFNGTTATRTNISSTFSSYTTGDIVIARVASEVGTSLTGITRYTGSYYVRTDGSTGTWDDYKNGNKTMYAFDNNELYPNEYYNHYWCAYLSPGVNVKAQVANDYNENLSVTLPNYNLTRQDGSKAYEGTNVRFAYNNENNLFEVQFLRAASGNFLFLYGYAEGGVAANNYVYNSADLAQKIDLEHAMSFSDLSDWMYQADFYINMPDGNHSAQIVIMSNYYLNDYEHAAKHINLGSPDPDSTDPFMVTGENITKGKYLIRVIYDYKTNRIVAAWLPNGDNLFQGALDANMMIVRTNDLDAKTIGNPSSNKTLTNVHRIYGVLEIDSLDYFSRSSHFYWISLPFDVKVKDVFGIDGYNSKWQIQRYRGDLRAQSGYQPGHTYWRVMNNASDNAIMEANRGYVVYLNLNKSDFKSVSYLDEGTGTTKYKSAKRLFFPSNNTSDYTLSYTAGANRTSILGKYICEVSDSDGSRKNKDSNWNVAGVPGYNKHIITRATTSDDLLMDPPKYYYAWTWNGSKDANNYVATAVTNETVFKPFEAYMFQYGGTLTWSPDVATSAASAPARREIMAQHNVSEQLLQINLETDYEWLDNALITLSDKQSVTGDFDLNGDLSKIMNSGSQIYSFAGKERVAGNLVPDTQDTVQLGVVIDAEATYTFHLDNMPGNYTIYLYDNETRQRTCLNHGDYDVILAAGTYDQRFVVEIAHAPSVVTDIDYASGSYLSVVEHDGRLYIEGISDGAELRLYDMTGRLFTACRYSSGEGIAAPASGVYMLSTNGVSKKIIVNHQP